eukprot:2056419-Pleurochrysis_carterae.AAC.1
MSSSDKIALHQAHLIGETHLARNIDYPSVKRHETPFPSRATVQCENSRDAAHTRARQIGSRIERDAEIVTFR